MEDLNLTNKQLQLLEFVKSCHGDQKRKYTFEPYWHHPLSVAKIVNKHITDDGAIEIALCHDLLEDTSCSSEQLFNFLIDVGYSSKDALVIKFGVEDLTDRFTSSEYPNLNRKIRKLKEAIRLSSISSLAQSVKYADLLDNTSSIVENDVGFAIIYLKEKKMLLDNMRKGNIDLLIECCWAIKEATKKLEKCV